MKNRYEVAKRLDEAISKWRIVNADYEKNPIDSTMFHALKELEVEIYVLRWVLDRI